MRRSLLLAAAFVLPCAALAEDPPPAATGTRLLDAVPRQADLVLATPDFRALAASLAGAGLGEAKVWRDAFEEQLRRWGAGLPGGERLVEGGRALLDAADGEVLLAGLDVRLPAGNAPTVRAGLFAMRTTASEKTLRAALDGIVEGGLRYRYEGRGTVQEIAGRRVFALPGSAATLYFCVQDGFLAAADHPLALGLFFRELAADGPNARSLPRPAGDLRLVVRHGRGDGAWEGYVWGDTETVQCPIAALPTASLPAAPAPSSVFALGAERPSDLPLSPVPLDDVWLRNISAYKPTDSSVVGIFAERPAPGSGARSQASDPRRDAVGAAWRLGWLRSLSSARFEVPFAGLDATLLRAPYESAAKLAGEHLGEFLEWTSADGKLAGPVGNGPATMLALRTLHDIGRGVPPKGAPAPVSSRPSAPLPDPAESKGK